MDGRGILDALKAATTRALRDVAAEAAQDMRDLLGTSYPPASGAGEPPHRRSGRLQGSITSSVEEFVDAEPQAFVQASAPYWRHLEYGTSKMAARPFIRPMREKWAPIAKQRVLDEIRKH